MKENSLSRRKFLRIATAFVASGAVAWGVNKPPGVDTEEVIVDQPFAPYHLDPDSEWKVEVPRFRGGKREY